MRIAALISDISTNSIVRSYPIIRTLQRTHEVTTIAATPDGRVFEPFIDALDYELVNVKSGLLGTERTMLDVARRINADIIYAFKPQALSFGSALLRNLRRRLPVLLDIEDWDNMILSNQGRLHKLLSPILYCRSGQRHQQWLDWVVDGAHRFASTKTVVSSFLQELYGGYKLPHGPDPDAFDPARYDRSILRKKWGLDCEQIVLFAGTARPHKGLEDLCEAIVKLPEPRPTLAVIGVANAFIERLAQEFSSVLRFLGPHPHKLMPQVWLAADLVVLPQRDEPFAQAQVPGKVFEAMAMSRPIVATDVSDLGEILGGCGRVIAPGDTDTMSQEIAQVLKDTDFAATLGTQAREKYLSHYSWDAMESTLTHVINSI